MENEKKVPKSELDNRMARFLGEMDKAYEKWELCAIAGALSLFYLTGTISDGVLMIRRGGESVLWIRRSYERAMLESDFGDIRRMRSFRDVAEAYVGLPDTLHLDTAHVSMEWFDMLSTFMPFKNVLPVEKVMLKTREVKSEYELTHIRNAGNTIRRLLKEEFPALVRGGISEAELGTDLFALFMKNGHHGVSRFAMRNVEMLLGHVAFGESPLYPAVFNSASGGIGLCPAAPIMGSGDRRLREGDIIFVDVCFCIDGYNVDRTLVYSYVRQQSEHILRAHSHCLELERLAASMLRPGVMPSEIYREVTGAVLPEFQHCFMGLPGHNAPFIGHSVGLFIDETPVIAKGFDSPLELGMTIAIEPKICIEGAGIVGSENTYLVTEGGGESLTGSPSEIIVVGVF